MNPDKQLTCEEIYLNDFLQILEKNLSVNSTVYISIQNAPYTIGVFEISNIHLQLSERKTGESDEVYHYELIIADNSDGNKKMTVLTADGLDSELIEMDCSGMRENVIIDLNEEGCRWEGGELNGKPFGFGCEYSENDNLVYEGFVFEGKKVCVGKEWNDDGNNNCLMYEGGYCNDERWGKGISYDLNGNVDYEGEWVSNHVITEKEKVVKNDLIVPMSIEEFVDGNEMFNDENITTLHFSPLLIRLKRIEIGNKCFKNVREFVLDGLPKLESVKFGDHCFYYADLSLKGE